MLLLTLASSTARVQTRERESHAARPAGRLRGDPEGQPQQVRVRRALGASMLDRRSTRASSTRATTGSCWRRSARTAIRSTRCSSSTAPTFPGCLDARATRSACSRCTTRRARTRRCCACRTTTRPGRASRRRRRRPELLAEIEHFFEVYKDLEEGKHVTVGEWEGREQAVEAGPAGTSAGVRRGGLRVGLGLPVEPARSARGAGRARRSRRRRSSTARMRRRRRSASPPQSPRRTPCRR